MMKLDTNIRERAERNHQRLLRVCTVALLLTGLSACSEPPYTDVDNARRRASIAPE